MSAERTAALARTRAALLSVVAAAFLIAIKLVTGLLTGSLGLLAEAAHSATDLVAALLTLFAVRVAIRPADAEHHYGHGKAEHLAALAESVFLGLVSVAIGAQSLYRLFGHGGREVDATWWALAVLGVVVAVDVSRALGSARAARRYRSAALASNALHFASDLAGSVAVFIGLALAAAGEPKADSVAALFVAVLVIIAARRLGSQSVDVLMDRTSREAEDAVRAAVATLDVELRRVRVRHAGGRHFVDLVIAVAPDTGVGQAHTAADAVETAVRDALGEADVVVHVEPRAAAGGPRERATAAALTVPDVREVHNVRVIHTADGYELSLHAKLPGELDLEHAHAVISELERTIQAAVPELLRVHTHIEPLPDTVWAVQPGGSEVAEQRALIDTVVERFTGAPPERVSFRDAERGRIALVTIALPPEQPLGAAHQRAGDIEEAVRERCPQLVDIIVHTEPAAERPRQDSNLRPTA
jgi:cation diffusion facilitator family transporter